MAVALAAVVVTWRRLFLGTDLNDEGFSIAVPYRFALGARPFVDEMNMLQTAQLFVYPFVKLYVSLRGGDEGIVLFTRHLYLVWTVAVSLLSCLSLKRLLRWEHALAASLICTTFVFVSTTNLSYNTLGAGLLVIGMALGAPAVLGGRLRLLAGAGAAQALAAFAYPTLGVALPVMAVCLVAAVPGRRRRALGVWALGAGIALGAEALVLVGCGIGNVMRCVRLQASGWHELNASSGLPRVWGLVTGVVGHIGLYPLVVVAALAVWSAYRRWPLARLALIATPLVLLPFGEQLVSGADGFGVVYGLAAPYFFLFVAAERRAQAARLLVWGYLPALAAAVVSGYSSTNGWVQMDVGLLPAMVLGGVFIALALAPRPADGPRLRRVLARSDPRVSGRRAGRHGRLPVPVPAARRAVLAADGDDPRRTLCRRSHHAAARRLSAAAALRPRPHDEAVGSSACSSTRCRRSTCSGPTVSPPTRCGSRASRGCR